MGVLIAEDNKTVNFDYLYDMEPTENGETRQFSGHHLHPVYAEKTVPIKVYQPTMPSDPDSLYGMKVKVMGRMDPGYGTDIQIIIQSKLIYD